LAQADWDRVDTSEDAAAYVAYLERIDASPLIQHYRQEFLGRLPCRPGERVLDAGCGVGGNARRLWPLMNRTGRVLGVDASQRMIRRARTLAPGLSFSVGNLCHLPLASGSFDGVLCDRVLMHLSHPLDAVREMVRVLRPGGWLGLCEPDWSRARLEPDGEISRIVLETHCSSFENGAIGGSLEELIEEAGCQKMGFAERDHAVQDYEKIWSLVNMERSLRRAVETGKLSEGEVNQWRGQLEEAARGGRFYLSFAGAICMGRKREA